MVIFFVCQIKYSINEISSIILVFKGMVGVNDSEGVFMNK